MQFHLIKATDNKPIANTIIKASTSNGELTGVTDAEGFVELGPFSDGEVITIGVEEKCYDNLELEFIYSRTVNFMALEMSPTVSKIQ